MGQGMNKVFLIGNLGMDPELRYTKNSTPVLNLRLACNESYVDSQQQKQERVEWFSVVVWGPRAEGLSKFLAKGQKIAVEGRIQSSTYTGDDGVEKYKIEIVAQEIVLCGGGGSDEQPNQRQAAPQGQGGGYQRQAQPPQRPPQSPPQQSNRGQWQRPQQPAQGQGQGWAP